MFCLTKVGSGFSVSRCPPEMVERFVSQPRKFIPECLPGCIPSFVCCSRCLAVRPTGWDAMGTVFLPAGGDVAEGLGLPILALIAQEIFSSRNRKQIVLLASVKMKPVPFAGREGNASSFVGEDAGTHIKPAVC